MAHWPKYAIDWGGVKISFINGAARKRRLSRFRMQKSLKNNAEWRMIAVAGVLESEPGARHVKADVYRVTSLEIVLKLFCAKRIFEVINPCSTSRR